MRFLVIMAALMTLSCNARKNKEVSSEYELPCIKVNSNRLIYRCENKEVLCYRSIGYDSLSMECHFKHIPRVKPMENK